jgi:hypothetical protein
MTHPAYLRDCARRLRIEKQLTLDQIAERLVLPQITVWSWISDLPLTRPRRATAGAALGNAAMQAKYRKLREDAYAQGLAEFEELAVKPTFRDFVVLYIAEGYKRNRNVVSLCNSDSRVICVAAHWMRSLSSNRFGYAVQYHADQDLDQLRQHWGAVLGIDGAEIRLQRKSNSSQLKRRSWRSEFGVLTIYVGDTLLRARLQGRIDRIKGEWG